jgi:hypothetical protein
MGLGFKACLRCGLPCAAGSMVLPRKVKIPGQGSGDGDAPPVREIQKNWAPSKKKKGSTPWKNKIAATRPEVSCLKHV